MTYQLLLTTLGQQKLAAAASAGGQPVRIAEFAVGQGVNVDFSQRLDQQVLVSKRYQGAVNGVASTAIAGQYEITCIVPQDSGGWFIREIGLIDSDGDLIWVGRVPEVQKPVASSTAAVDYRIKAVISIDNPDVNLVIDANVVTATQSWVANNFVSNPRFAQFLDLAYPYGYPYWSHSKSNPKPLFDAMFGFETHWRRLEGVGLVAVKDGDAHIGQPMLTLGQVGNTELATTIRPHSYPIYTSYLFERYDPAAVIETVWRVTANKTSVNEGEAVRFTVTANNLPDGQILDWIVKEGALNGDSNDIVAPEKVDNGTVILTNGQAIIDFTTTPDDNTEEFQKHVRLTVGAPANLSINVPINDTGHYETVIHISESTTNGIDLAEYYNAQSGGYPSATETVRFIVDAGVDIIAPNTTTAAITEGANWPSEASATVENHGRILGRGGDGGVPADYYLTKINNEGNFINPVISQSQRGGDGGTAIKGDMTIDNYGVIAGGGGGGGGAGFFKVANGSFTDFCHGGGAGGGAPLGRRYPNAKTYEQYWEKFEQSAPKYVVGIPKQGNLNYDAWADLSLFGKDDTAACSLRSVIFSGNPLESALVFIGDAYRHDLSTGKFSYVIPRYLDETETNYKVASWGDDPYAWVDMGMRQPTHATIEERGVGGINLYSGDGDTYALNNLARLVPSLDLSKNKGGDGGAIGENGEASLLGEFFSVGSGVYPSSKRVTKSELQLIEEPNVGGLAGFVKEGGVTINNYSGGTTKGR